MNEQDKQPQADINRRQFLRRFGLAIGGSTLAASLTPAMMSNALAYSRQVASESVAGKVFNQPQMMMLKHICQLVIPKTDTPGAGDVDTHGFLDNQLANCFPKKVANKNQQLLNLLNKQAKGLGVDGFVTLMPAQQVKLLNQLDTGTGPFSMANRKQFKQIKGLIAFGYYTSEAGAMQELRYLPVPGGYTGSIPYQKGQGAWSS